MAWVKLDDAFFSHPKVLRAGRDARDVFLVGLTYCATQLTDGFIPDAALRMIGAQADVEDVRDCANRLVNVGMWEPVEGGYQVHDYLEYQPSSAQVRQQRGKNAQRQASYRERHEDDLKEKRNARRNGVTHGVSNAVRNGRVTHAPYPSPIREESNDSSRVAHATPSRAPRPPDALWQAMETLMECKPETDSGKRTWAVALADLKKTGATPEDVAVRGGNYIAKYGRDRLTPHALVKFWGELVRAPVPSQPRLNGHNGHNGRVPNEPPPLRDSRTVDVYADPIDITAH